MRVLFLVADGPHHHDYGSDFLFDGFCDLFGFEHVFDFPEKSPLHDGLDECEIDSDQMWPKRGYSLQDLLSNKFDMAVLGTQPGEKPELMMKACRGLPNSVPIIATDFSDSVTSRLDWYEEVAGRSVLYFKRELRPGERYAEPLPLMYPKSRVAHINEAHITGRLPRVFYRASSHGNKGPGLPRIEIVDGLRCRANPDRLDVCLSVAQGRGTRPSPDEYHARMQSASIGVSWNGAANFDNNRFWENFAYGLAQVSQRPTIQLPDAPLNGQHVLYEDRPEHVVQAVVDLLGDHEKRKKLALAGHQHFLRYHTSEARARYIVERSFK